MGEDSNGSKQSPLGNKKLKVLTVLLGLSGLLVVVTVNGLKTRIYDPNTQYVTPNSTIVTFTTEATGRPVSDLEITDIKNR